VAADPFEVFIVFFVIRIVNGLKKIGVATGTADIFRRASPFSGNANRIASPGLWF